MYHILVNLATRSMGVQLQKGFKGAPKNSVDLYFIFLDTKVIVGGLLT